MLQFFRKYQRAFLFFLSIIIICSFSFFGTYSAFTAPTHNDPVVAKGIDGSSITRAEIDQMARFLSTDQNDLQATGGRWGPNFLNDGVIATDILEPGLVYPLFSRYAKILKPDFEKRLPREKRWTPYQHPEVKFLSAMSIWSSFAPEIIPGLNEWNKITDPTSQKALELRTRLYLAQKAFPEIALKQVLHYQTKQYPWIPEDSGLLQRDLSLFGYRNLDDWFGSRFTRLVSELIINCSILAEQRGYEVTRNEAYADLLVHAERTFRENPHVGQLGVSNSKQYMQEQLRRMGMSTSDATNVWRQVLLFRRLMNDASYSVLADPVIEKEFLNYAYESVEGNLYQLPESLHLTSEKDLMRFAAYWNAVSADGNLNSLNFRTVAQIKKTAPELIQKRYLVDIVHLNKEKLQGRVGVRKMWSWQTEPENWNLLAKEFSFLPQDPSTDRFEILEALKTDQRQKVDAYSRQVIVDRHPEWIEESLNTLTPERQTLTLRLQSESIPLQGYTSIQEVIALLEKGDNAIHTPDQKNYYKIKVVDQSSQEEILTFAEAKKEGLLEGKGSSETFLQALKKQFPSIENNDVLAPYLFYTWADTIKKDLSQGKSAAIKETTDTEESTQSLTVRPSLEEQWLFNKKPFHFTRNEKGTNTFDIESLFKLQEDDWSQVHVSPNGSIAFAHITSKASQVPPEKLTEKVYASQKTLGKEAIRAYFPTLLDAIDQKTTLNLNFLNSEDD